MASKNWEQLRTDLESTLKTQLAGVLTGSIDDLNGPIRDAANRLTVAVRRGEPGLIAEIKDQLGIEMVRKGITVKGAGNGVLDAVLTVGLGMLFQGATAGMQSVIPN